MDYVVNHTFRFEPFPWLLVYSNMALFIAAYLVVKGVIGHGLRYISSKISIEVVNCNRWTSKDIFQKRVKRVASTEYILC